MHQLCCQSKEAAIDPAPLGPTRAPCCTATHPWRPRGARHSLARTGAQHPGARSPAAARHRCRARPRRRPDQRRQGRPGRDDLPWPCQAGGLPVRLRLAAGPAPPGHLRRSGPPHHGARRLPRPDRGHHPHPPAGGLRRHGRLSQDPGQCPQPRHAGGGPRQAGHPRARSVRRARELRGPQQCPAESLPRRLRLRLRVRLGHRVLRLRPLRRGAAAGARALRPSPGDHAAHPGRRAARHLFALPADQPDHRPGAAGADPGTPRRSRDHRLRGRGRNLDRGPRHRRLCEAAVAARLGGAVDGAGGGLRDVRQGSRRFRAGVQPGLPGARRDAAGGVPLRAVH